MSSQPFIACGKPARRLPGQGCRSDLTRLCPVFSHFFVCSHGDKAEKLSLFPACLKENSARHRQHRIGLLICSGTASKAAPLSPAGKAKQKPTARSFRHYNQSAQRLIMPATSSTKAL